MFGRNVKVGTDEEIDKLAEEGEVLYVCLRLGDSALERRPKELVERSRIGNCQECGAFVVFDPVHLRPTMKIVCNKCLPEDFDAFTSQPQRAELQRWLNR